MMVVRMAEPADAAELYRLNELFNGSPECAGVAEIAHALLTPRGELVAVAQSSAGLCGFICAQVLHSFCYDCPVGEITELFVEEQYRRTGLGARLMEHMHEQLRAQGVSDVRLATGGSNTGAQAFYRSCGYELEDELTFGKSVDQ